MSRSVPLAAADMTSDYVVDSDAEAEMATESTSVGMGGAAAAVASDNEREEPSCKNQDQCAQWGMRPTELGR